MKEKNGKHEYVLPIQFGGKNDGKCISLIIKPCHIKGNLIRQNSANVPEKAIINIAYYSTKTKMTPGIEIYGKSKIVEIFGIPQFVNLLAKITDSERGRKGQRKELFVSPCAKVRAQTRVTVPVMHCCT